MKKTNEVSSCYETRISKNALTPPNLSKVNLVILYLNRNLTHQNPLPENILKDSIEILENFKKLSQYPRVKSIRQGYKLKQNCETSPAMHRKMGEKIRVKKVSNCKFKEQEKDKELKVVNPQQIIQKLRNRILDNEIKISQYKKTISKQKQSIYEKEKSLKKFQLQVDKARLVDKKYEKLVLQRIVQIHVLPTQQQSQQIKRITIKQNGDEQIIKNAIIERQNETKSIIIAYNNMIDSHLERAITKEKNKQKWNVQ